MAAADRLERNHLNAIIFEMGVTALVRWPNATTNALDLVKQNIIANHAGVEQGKWLVGIKSLRAVSDPDGLRLDRSMCCVTMGNHTFAVLDDQAAPQVADFASLPNPMESPPLSSPTGTGRSKNAASSIPPPPHYRTTLVTVEPVGALESLLSQLGTRWASTRQQGAAARNQPSATGNQLVIEGSVFTIGNDWVLRVGNVTLAGGAMKGMLLEAEYLPLPKIHSNPNEGTPELLTNMLIAMLPDIKNAAPVAVTVDDTQWAEVHWNCNEQAGKQSTKQSKDDMELRDDVFAYEAEEDPSQKQPGDWIGVERDRRSAFHIVGALRPEGMLST